MPLEVTYVRERLALAVDLARPDDGARGAGATRHVGQRGAARIPPTAAVEVVRAKRQAESLANRYNRATGHPPNWFRGGRHGESHAVAPSS